MRFTELMGCLRLHSWSLWKALEEEEGCICLVSCPFFGLAVKRFLNIE
jgi:hypothetical protein